MTVTALGTYTLNFMASGFTFQSPTITQSAPGITIALISGTEVQITDTVTQCGGNPQESTFILHADTGDTIDPTIINNAQPSTGP